MDAKFVEFSKNAEKRFEEAMNGQMDGKNVVKLLDEFADELEELVYDWVEFETGTPAEYEACKLMRLGFVKVRDGMKKILAGAEIMESVGKLE